MFFEENFSGVRPFELQLTVTDSNMNVLDPKVIQDMMTVESYLKDGIWSRVSKFTTKYIKRSESSFKWRLGFSQSNSKQ